MSFDAISNRFSPAVHVVNFSSTTLTVSDAVATEVYGSSFNLEPGMAAAGMGFRWTIAGTKTGTNEAHVVNLMSTLSSTPLLTLTADDTSAVDWQAVITLVLTGGASQKISGIMISNTTDGETDYATGTASLKGGAKLYVTIDGHTNDDVTADFCILEAWQYPVA